MSRRPGAARVLAGQVSAAGAEPGLSVLQLRGRHLPRVSGHLVRHAARRAGAGARAHQVAQPVRPREERDRAAGQPVPQPHGRHAPPDHAVQHQDAARQQSADAQGVPRVARHSARAAAERAAARPLRPRPQGPQPRGQLNHRAS